MTNKESLEKNFSNNFLDWILNELNNKGNISLVKENLTTKDDVINFRISKFIMYIKEKSFEQLYFPFEQTPDGDYVYYFKLKDEIFYMIIFDELFFEKNNLKNGFDFIISKTNDIPLDFIYLDEEIPCDVLKDRELVEYIVINEKVKENFNLNLLMDSISKATTISTIAHINSDRRKYYLWFNDGDELKFWINDKNFQKRIFLEASNEKMEELCEKFYSPNLAVCSLGIMNRFKVKKYIDEFKTFKI